MVYVRTRTGDTHVKNVLIR